MPNPLESPTQLDAMALFARVVEAGGFSAAARELGVSRSTLIRSLTKNVGGPAAPSP